MRRLNAWFERRCSVAVASTRNSSYAPAAIRCCDTSSRLKVVVLGYIVRGPIGGMAWHHLNYVLGLKRLGHEVLFLEDSDEYPSCYDPSQHRVSTDPTYGLKFIADAFKNVGLGNMWAYFDAHRNEWHGQDASYVESYCRDADILLNVSGVNLLRSCVAQIPCRVLIDTDPAFTQVRHLTDAGALSRASIHNRFFSFGESIAAGNSQVPDDGFKWQPTRQPVVLDAWPVTTGPSDATFTTVMQWDSYPAIEFAGQRFGMKSDSFESVLQLPGVVDTTLEIALGGHTAPRQQLTEMGWRLVDPLAITHDPWTYQRYIQHSRAEFAVAKHGYVASRCGWLSERTACYLASGRPAVVQDTGFSDHLPCGSGLLPFHDLKSAKQAIERVQSDYWAHCQAARDLAATYFDSSKVLVSLIERALSTAPNSAAVQ